jgi:hypothetical protein
MIKMPGRKFIVGTRVAKDSRNLRGCSQRTSSWGAARRA